MEKECNLKKERFIGMLSREECEECLQFLKEHAMELVDDEDMEGNIVYDYYNFSEEYLREYVEPIEKLIAEHFDNPPLKFEELKEGIWIWDNYWNQYLEICEVYPQTKEFDVLIHQNRINRLRYEPMKFEENRFYRKQVQE